MFLSRRGAAAHQVRCGSADPGHRDGSDGQQQAHLAAVGRARAVKVEATGFGVGEETFDRPAFAVDVGDAGSGLCVGHDQRFPCGQAFGGPTSSPKCDTGHFPRPGGENGRKAGFPAPWRR